VEDAVVVAHQIVEDMGHSMSPACIAYMVVYSSVVVVFALNLLFEVLLNLNCRLLQSEVQEKHS